MVAKFSSLSRSWYAKGKKEQDVLIAVVFGGRGVRKLDGDFLNSHSGCVFWRVVLSLRYSRGATVGASVEYWISCFSGRMNISGRVLWAAEGRKGSGLPRMAERAEPRKYELWERKKLRKWRHDIDFATSMMKAFGSSPALTRMSSTANFRVVVLRLSSTPIPLSDFSFSRAMASTYHYIKHLQESSRLHSTFTS